MDVGLLSTKFPGWTLTEIRRMPYSQREFWVDLVVKRDGVTPDSR